MNIITGQMIPPGTVITINGYGYAKDGTLIQDFRSVKTGRKRKIVELVRFKVCKSGGALSDLKKMRRK
jgi:hypothetical protein